MSHFRFVQDWLEGWNSRNPDRIMAHDEDAVFQSPSVLALGGSGDGIVRGRRRFAEKALWSFKAKRWRSYAWRRYPMRRLYGALVTAPRYRRRVRESGGAVLEGDLMTEELVWAAAALCAGVAMATQGGANAGLSAKIGLGSALIVNTSIVLIGAVIFWALQGPRTEFLSADNPWTLYIGGVCGFIVILAIAFVMPKQGAALTIALMVLGQGLAALTIDHYGLLGMRQEPRPHPISLVRLVGVGLVIGGAALLRI
jgi:transporter family-2 protein